MGAVKSQVRSVHIELQPWRRQQVLGSWFDARDYTFLFILFFFFSFFFFYISSTFLLRLISLMIIFFLFLFPPHLPYLRLIFPRKSLCFTRSSIRILCKILYLSLSLSSMILLLSRLMNSIYFHTKSVYSFYYRLKRHRGRNYRLVTWIIIVAN